MGGKNSKVSTPIQLREAAQFRVGAFYDALNTPSSKDVEALIESVADTSWRSYSGATVSKGRDEFIQQVIGFGKVLPDLKWDIQEMYWIEGANKVVVRSIASGTPAADFMGIPHGGKSFSIYAIDIHTLNAEGRLIRADHVEDWAGALRGLK